MAKFFDLPLDEEDMSRILIPSDTLKVLEDKEGKIFVTDNDVDYYKVDMTLKMLKKLFSCKQSIAVGKRRPKPKAVITVLEGSKRVN